METLVITVADKTQADRIVKQVGKQPGVVDVLRKDASIIDPITLLSEQSLAEAWDSPEDDIWDDFCQELCTEKAI